MQLKRSKRCVTVTSLFVIFVAAVSGAADRTVCSKLDGAAIKCCKMDTLVSSLAKYSRPLSDDCLDLKGCDRALCIAEKVGFSTPDGKVDKSKVEKIIERDFSSMTDTVAVIREKCIYGDLSMYGLPDQCELVKYDNCVRVYFLGLCTEWETEGDCASIKQAADECFKLHV